MKSLLGSGEFDMVIVGPPFCDEVIEVPHPNVKVIKTAAELKDIVRQITMKTDNSTNESHEKARTHIEQPQDFAINDTNRRILLVTTKLATIEELKSFNLNIRTTGYSAQRALAKAQPDIIIWDIDESHDIKGAPLFVWGKDVKNSRDLQVILQNEGLSLSK